MSTSTAQTTALRLAVVNLDFPEHLRPPRTRTAPFWVSDTEEDRMFFVIADEHLDGPNSLLVVGTTDPRAEGMREPSALGEPRALADCGLDADADAHKVWSIEGRFLKFIDEITPVDDRLDSFFPLDLATLADSPDIRNQWLGTIETVTVCPAVTAGSTANPLVLSVVESGMGGWRITDNEIQRDSIPPSLKGQRGWWVSQSVISTLIEKAAAVTKTASEDEQIAVPIEVAEDHGILHDRVAVLVAELAAAQQEGVRLQTRLNSEQEALRLARRNHENDINVIGEVLLEEARNRDWCSEYDSVIEGLNGSLNLPLPVREQEYEVTLRVEYVITKTVSARDENAAYEIASQEVDGSDTQYESIDDISLVDCSQV